jgi:hypothetical protein
MAVIPAKAPMEVVVEEKGRECFLLLSVSLVFSLLPSCALSIYLQLLSVSIGSGTADPSQLTPHLDPDAFCLILDMSCHSLSYET